MTATSSGVLPKAASCKAWNEKTDDKLSLSHSEVHSSVNHDRQYSRRQITMYTSTPRYCIHCHTINSCIRGGIYGIWKFWFTQFQQYWDSKAQTYLKMLCTARGAPHLNPTFLASDRVPNSRKYLVQKINRNILILQTIPPSPNTHSVVSQTVNELMLKFNLCIFLFHPSSQPQDMPPEHSVSHVIRFFFFFNLGWWNIHTRAACQTVLRWTGWYDGM